MKSVGPQLETFWHKENPHLGYNTECQLASISVGFRAGMRQSSVCFPSIIQKLLRMQAGKEKELTSQHGWLNWYPQEELYSCGWCQEFDLQVEVATIDVPGKGDKTYHLTFTSKKDEMATFYLFIELFVGYVEQ